MQWGFPPWGLGAPWGGWIGGPWGWGLGALGDWDDWGDWGDWAYAASNWYPQPFDYYGLSVIPVWDDDYQQWGFWEAGIWLPLPVQPPPPYGYGYGY